MTIPNGNILFNSSTGNDTAASGLGPSTAVSGMGASTNNTTTVDLSADLPDLSGVIAGDLLWVDSTAGVQFSIIASVNDGADTVTCDVIFTQTEISRNWGIGGKRNSLQTSRNLIEDDIVAGWVIELESGYTDTITTTLTLDIAGNNVDGMNTVKGSDGAVTPPLLTFSGTGTFINFIVGFWIWEGMDFENTNASPGICFSSTDGVNQFAYIGLTRIRCRDVTNEFSSFQCSRDSFSFFNPCLQSK